jgi:uncharacterized damage-inducible protein DinB
MPHIDELLQELDEEARNTRRVLELVTDFGVAKAILCKLDEPALATPWRMVSGDREVGAVPRGAFLRSVMLNHWYHHRGQLTVYLRQTGALVPAIYGDSADEKMMQG